MKKLALVLTLFTASIFGANAQVQFGIKAGANFATLTGDDVSGAKTVTGLNAGILVKIPLMAGLSLQPEAYYSMQGAKYSDGSVDATFDINYINIPVLVKYQLPVGLFFETGPQFGVRMSAKIKADGQSEDEKDNVKSSDLAWSFGAGYQLPVIPLGIDVRYNLGLSNIANGDGASGSSKNGVFQAGVFYLFGGAKK